MVIIRIKRTTIYISIFALLFLSIVLLVLNISSNKKMSIGAFLSSSNDTFKEEQQQIEIYDITAGKVIAKYNKNDFFQKEANNYLRTIAGMYVKIKAFPDSGYIIKIPLSPPVGAVDKLLTDYGITSVDEVYVIFPQQGEPYLLILDENSRPLLFNFTADTDAIKNYLIRKGSIYVKAFKPDIPSKGSMEELYHDISTVLLLPYIQEAVDDYYEINVGYSPGVDPWQPKILSIDRRTYTFIIKLEVAPYLGAHNSIGIDHITVKVSPSEVLIEKFEHIKSYPVPPWLQH